MASARYITILELDAVMSVFFLLLQCIDNVNIISRVDPEELGDMYLQNVGIHQQDYMLQ